MNTINQKNKPCPCGLGLAYTVCCGPYHAKESFPATAESLMRSRYSAYVLQLVDHLVVTTHQSTRHLHDKAEIADWAKRNTWQKLEICEVSENVVEFKAFYQNDEGQQVHHERSTFKKEDGRWFYVKGIYFA